MIRSAGHAVVLLTLAVAGGACSSWDTGSPPNDGPERACLATIEAFARAAERCGEDYHRTYDALLVREANGDCKNVRTVRDEAALRTTCLPFIMSEACEDVLNGKSDPTCAKQLVRTTAVNPSL